jgi:hypothetical protein
VRVSEKNLLSHKSLQEGAGVLISVNIGMGEEPFARLAGSWRISAKPVKWALARRTGLRSCRCFLIFGIPGAGRARQHSLLLCTARQTVSDGGQSGGLGDFLGLAMIAQVPKRGGIDEVDVSCDRGGKRLFGVPPRVLAQQSHVIRRLHPPIHVRRTQKITADFCGR